VEPGPGQKEGGQVGAEGREMESKAVGTGLQEAAIQGGPGEVAAQGANKCQPRCMEQAGTLEAGLAEAEVWEAED